MKLEFQKEIADQICTVTVSTGSFTQDEQNLMDEFGEPEVDVGGDFFLPTSATPVPAATPAYMHSSTMKQISTDFGDAKNPFTITFDGRTSSAEIAIAEAEYWIANMKLRFEIAMAELRAKADTFTGTESEEI